MSRDLGPIKSARANDSSICGSSGFLMTISPALEVFSRIAVASCSLVDIGKLSSNRAKVMFSWVKYQVCLCKTLVHKVATFLSIFLKAIRSL